MTLKAILFDFNGVIINDELIHEELIDEIILGENLRPEASEYKEFCQGRSDRACLKAILSRRGRLVSDDYLTKLIEAKTQAYQQKLDQLDTLPIYPGIEKFLEVIKDQDLSIALVSGARFVEIELVLQKAGISDYFSVIVARDDYEAIKPHPNAYLFAIDKFNQSFPQLNLKPSQCLAIEDTPVGIKAAKQAGMQVVGVANTYPLHMLQRQADWTVDYLTEIELERVKKVLTKTTPL